MSSSGVGINTPSFQDNLLQIWQHFCGRFFPEINTWIKNKLVIFRGHIMKRIILGLFWFQYELLEKFKHWQVVPIISMSLDSPIKTFLGKRSVASNPFCNSEEAKPEENRGNVDIEMVHRDSYGSISQNTERKCRPWDGTLRLSWFHQSEYIFITENIFIFTK